MRRLSLSNCVVEVICALFAEWPPDVASVDLILCLVCSCVGVWQNDRVEIIANDQGNRTTPSYVGFTDTERLIGDAAKNQVAMNPRNTVFDAKRLIGRKFNDTAVQQDMKHWPFTVLAGPEGKPIIEGEQHPFLQTLCLGKNFVGGHSDSCCLVSVLHAHHNVFTPARTDEVLAPELTDAARPALCSV